jgi:hypothetical protein
MDALSSSLTAFCAPTARAHSVPKLRGIGVSTSNQSFLPNLLSTGEEWRCPAGYGARFLLAY